MAWRKAVNPDAPTPPRVHSPTRCMNCIHEKAEHDDAVGCLVPGGTKWIDNEQDPPFGACSCEKFIPVEEVSNE